MARVGRIQLLPWRAAAILAIASVAPVQAQSGDLLVNVSGPNSRIVRLRQNGSQVWQSTGGTGSEWEGASPTPLGHIVTGRRNPSPGIDIFDSTGVEISTFNTPQMVLWPGDVSVFSDGTLAVSDQGFNTLLYSKSGTWVGVIGGGTHPFGSFVDASDNFWLCDIADNGSGGGSITKSTKAGVWLQTMQLTFIPGDLIVAPDGTLWVADRNNRKVVHLAANGTQLGGFPTSVAGLFSGIAMASDGTLFVTGESSVSIYHYTSTGTLLGSFPIGITSGNPVFIGISGCGDAAAYCAAKINSLGCLPAMDWTGGPSASLTSGFVVLGRNVRNNKNGLLFYGTNGPSALPFQGGTLCVKTPLKRTGSVNSGGTAAPANDCTGVYSLDLNTFAHSPGPPAPLPALTVPGTVVNCQWWGRDQGFAPPNNVTLTDAIQYVVCPR